MATDFVLRRQALATIKDWEHKNRSELLKAVFDLRHNADRGDEDVLYPLMEHSDDGVVASTLYSLFEVYNQHRELAHLISRLAWGDTRDCGEMPIQSMAISLLTRIAKTDADAREQLTRIAEDAAINAIPRKRAWQCLADLHGIEWFQAYTDEMVMSPESEESERIRDRIRRIIQTTVDKEKRAVNELRGRSE